MEQLPFSHNRPPLIEHPLTADGNPWKGGWAGPARVVVNERYRTEPEVMYHDPEKKYYNYVRGRGTTAFSKGVYRKRAARKKGKGKGKAVDRG